MMLRVLFVSGALSLAACGSDGSGLATPAQCNPLGGTNCVTPWPSGIYQVEDSASPSGLTNDIPQGALPTNLSDVTIDPDLVLNQRTGFTPAAPILTAFPTGVDGSNLVHYTDYPASVTPASPTVLLNASTGELVEHFAELDARAASTPDKQALFIRPSKILDFGTRYIVAIKKTLKAADGSDLPIPEGFQSILDGGSTGHELLERMRPRYEDIFAKLSAVGINREDLVVAWDFGTLVRADVQTDLLSVRDQTVAFDDTASNLAYTVITDTPHDDPDLAREIVGTFTAPLYMSQDGEVTPATVIERDGAGLPMQVGTYEAPFVAIIPECALLPQNQPVPMLIYGHGLLGDASQVGSSGVRHLITRQCMVAFGTDFRGFSEIDLPNLARMLNDANKQDLFFPIQMQGFANHMTLTATARGPMASTLFIDGMQNSVVDPTQVYYYGISQGGIMGTLIMAMDPTIMRGVLQVGAINYSTLLERSLDWPVYRTIMIGSYPDPLDVALLISIMQEYWDADPANIAADLAAGTIPGTPQKQILMQIAVADDEVANVASDLQARTMGYNTVMPSVYEPIGVPGATGPLQNGYAIYDFGAGPTIPLTNEPPPDNNVHSRVRKQEAAINQIGTFLFTGEIQNFCTSDCACQDGNCGEEY